MKPEHTTALRDLTKPTETDSLRESAFNRFQEFLRRHGNVNLARLEEELREGMQRLFNPSSRRKVTSKERDKLAHKLLLRYCLTWAIASTKDLPPLAGDEDDAAEILMEPHREQLEGYAHYFSSLREGKVSELLKDPECMDPQTMNRLKAMVEKHAVPKAPIYFPESPLFMEESMLRMERDYAQDDAVKVAALWGPNNVKQLFGAESERTRYWVDRLARLGKVGTGKIARLKP